MRRFDKIENVRKANLLAEQRYLNGKNLISENTNEVAAQAQPGSNSPANISGELQKSIPTLANDATLNSLADKMVNDPNAIKALQQFMGSISGVNELENAQVKVPNMTDISKAINLGLQKTQKTGLNEGEDMGGKIGAIFASLVGGAYLADKYFPNPMVMKKVATNIGFIEQLANQHDPMLVQALGGLAGAVLGILAFKVFKKLQGNKQS